MKVGSLKWVDAFPELFADAKVAVFWERQVGASLDSCTPLESEAKIGAPTVRRFLLSAAISSELREASLGKICQWIRFSPSLKAIAEYSDDSFFEIMESLKVADVDQLARLSLYDLMNKSGSFDKNIINLIESIAAYSLEFEVETRHLPRNDVSKNTEVSAEKTDIEDLSDSPDSNDPDIDIESRAREGRDTLSEDSGIDLMPRWARLIYELAGITAREHDYDAPLFPVSVFSEKDLSVTELIDAILELRASDILDPDHHLPPVAATNIKISMEYLPATRSKHFVIAANEMNHIYSAFTVRERTVLKERIFYSKPTSLDQVGKKFGVTRERIRQIAKIVNDQWKQMLEQNQFLFGYLTTIDQDVKIIESIDSIISRWPEVDEYFVSNDISLLELMSSVYKYEYDEIWICRGELEKYRTETERKAAELADDYGLIPYTVLTAATGYELSAKEFGKWFEQFGWKIMDDFVLTNMSSADKRAASILALRGQAMSLDELYDAVGAPLAIRSFTNALHSSPFIKRVSLNNFGLVSWDAPEYSGIRDGIENLLESNQGKIRLDELEMTLVSTFGVSAGSVRTYANIPPYCVINGFVKRRIGTNAPRRNLTSTKGLFLIGSKTILRSRVTNDHLRGSGFVAPAAAAHEVNLTPGTKIELNSAVGPIGMYWSGVSPTFGSIRSLLFQDNLTLGQRILICIDTSRNNLSVIADPGMILKGDEFLKVFFGADSISELGHIVRKSVGLEEASIYDAIVALRTRGDDEIADALQPHIESLTSTGNNELNSHISTNVEEWGELLGDLI